MKAKTAKSNFGFTYPDWRKSALRLRRGFIVVAAAALVGCGGQTQALPGISASPVPTEIGGKNSAFEEQSAQNSNGGDGYEVLNYEEQKAVWISYIDLSEMLTGGEEAFCESAAQVFDNVSAIGCNTVYVHVRAFGDAYYESQLYAKNEAAQDFDPLEIMIDEAHARGLSLHAWINPFRCDTGEKIEKMQGTKLYEWYTNPEKYEDYIVKPDGDERYWLNPGCEEVRQLIADGAAEIAENYDVDGINIDDYFYPTTDESFDEKTYSESTDGMTLEEYRLNSCSLTVKGIYDAIKQADSDVLFGVSPQGNLENNYTAMYADVKLWCSAQGYLDYIVPQIYFGYENETCPFTETAALWASIASGGSAKLICGLGAYKIGSDEEFGDDGDVIKRQIGDIESNEKYSGYALYFQPGDILGDKLSLFVTGD